MPIFDYADFVWGDKNNCLDEPPSSSSQQSRKLKSFLTLIHSHQPQPAESLRSLNWQPLTTRSVV